MANFKSTYLSITLGWLLWLLATSCSTGIEGTRTIKMTRNDQRDVQPGAEQVFISGLKSEPLIDWKIGKKFLISDNKASVVLELPAFYSQSQDSIKLAGKVIRYVGTTSRRTPGGNEVLIIEFEDSTSKYQYNTSLQPSVSFEKVNGLNIPMLIDLDMVARADSMLKNKQLWTLTRLWYDENGNIVDGHKFVPVHINRVQTGNMLFPLKVEFTDTAGMAASMLMNVSQQEGNGPESRTFPTLFSLTDPKLKYPGINDEHWKLICDGRVNYGMTKDECRLALGNPSEVDSGHNWDYIVDIWGYKDGTYLQFRDGLLVGFRK